MRKSTSVSSVAEILSTLQKKHGVVGRDSEIEALVHCIQSGKNILLEGAVGVGKTFLVAAVSSLLSKRVVRVDGDTRYTEQKLTGWFDPPAVLKKGYGKETFIEGPLVEAMRSGSILFINELNRMPEGVQNILLPALDEKQIEIPKLGTLKATDGFALIATQNPKEFVATSHLSEALLDRFELLPLGYQSEEEERDILKKSSHFKEEKSGNGQLLEWCLSLVRFTRESALFKRGASIRAGISIYDIASSMGGDFESFVRAATLSLPTRVELSDEGLDKGMPKILGEFSDRIKKKIKS